MIRTAYLVGRLSAGWGAGSVGTLLTLLLWLVATPAIAVPSFSRQTGMSCTACHREFPVLTETGRQFKLSGYTSIGGDSGEGGSDFPPLAFMLQPSFTHTSKSLSSDDTPTNFRRNNNPAISQASVFYAGRLFGGLPDHLGNPDVSSFLNKFGTFMQATYDGVGRKMSWDNMEVRYSDRLKLGARDIAYGVYVNNNPTMSDPWNTLPVWTFPFSGSGIAVTPGASTMLDGGLGQQVGGVGAYAMIDRTLYLDVAGYRALGKGFQKTMGSYDEEAARVSGMAPYWRAAYTKSSGGQSFEIGAFGMTADTFPQRNTSKGTDRISDFGFDSQYQISAGSHDVTAMVSHIRERASYSASKALDFSDNRVDRLWTSKVGVNYVYDKTYGALAGYFNTDGTVDGTLYDGRNHSPRNDGFVFQLSWLPLSRRGGPKYWPDSSVKVSLQYVMYNRFDGARRNYDGNGRNASDNNTLYLETWISF